MGLREWMLRRKQHAIARRLKKIDKQLARLDKYEKSCKIWKKQYKDEKKKIITELITITEGMMGVDYGKTNKP